MIQRATGKTFELKIERRIEAPRERVFQAFLDVEDLSRWYAPRGLDVVDVSTDARVGGEWSVVMRVEGEDTEYHAEGVYREISPPERLVFTHHWLTDDDPVETLITVELHEEDGGTRLVMRHEGLPTEKARDENQSGWSSCYDRLVEMFS